MWAKTEMRCWRQVWNLEGMQAGSPPPLLRSLKPFAGNQRMPEAEITCIAVHAASWPRLTIAVGLATSQIYVLRGGSGTAEHLSLMCSLPSPGASHPHAGLSHARGPCSPQAQEETDPSNTETSPATCIDGVACM